MFGEKQHWEKVDTVWHTVCVGSSLNKTLGSQSWQENPAILFCPYTQTPTPALSDKQQPSSSNWFRSTTLHICQVNVRNTSLQNMKIMNRLLSVLIVWPFNFRIADLSMQLRMLTTEHKTGGREVSQSLKQHNHMGPASVLQSGSQQSVC